MCFASFFSFHALLQFLARSSLARLMHFSLCAVNSKCCPVPGIFPEPLLPRSVCVLILCAPARNRFSVLFPQARSGRLQGPPGATAQNERTPGSASRASSTAPHTQATCPKPADRPVQPTRDRQSGCGSARSHVSAAHRGLEAGWLFPLL